MPVVLRCGCCPWKILAPSLSKAEVYVYIHFKNCHEKTHEGCVIQDTEEFIDEEYHKGCREVIFYRIPITKEEYEISKRVCTDLYDIII